MSRRFSRRAVLGQIGLGLGLASGALPVRHAFAALDNRPWFFLSNDEARWLAAIVDVFIPADDHPSASQAGVVDFIDLQLAGDYGQGMGLYMEGPFPDGATPQQGYQVAKAPAELFRDGLQRLRDAGRDPTAMPEDEREGFVDDLSKENGEAGTFFSELLTLTKEGYFADPIYRGNDDYAGWRMVGFPGAHAYYTDQVDAHNLPFSKPPMGVAHGSASGPGPRPIPGREG